VSKVKPQAFAIIKGASNWRMYSIFDEDPMITGVISTHPNNAHNLNKLIPMEYLAKYAAKKACNSLNEKDPQGYYGVCKIIEEKM
jgi:hypothetical protein